MQTWTGRSVPGRFGGYVYSSLAAIPILIFADDPMTPTLPPQFEEEGGLSEEDLNPDDSQVQESTYDEEDEHVAMHDSASDASNGSLYEESSDERNNMRGHRSSQSDSQYENPGFSRTPSPPASGALSSTCTTFSLKLKYVHRT